MHPVWKAFSKHSFRFLQIYIPHSLHLCKSSELKPHHTLKVFFLCQAHWGHGEQAMKMQHPYVVVHCGFGSGGVKPEQVTATPLWTVDVNQILFWNAFALFWADGIHRWKEMVVLGDVLQDVKDELHHRGLVVPRSAFAVNHGSQNAIEGAEVLSWEELPVTPSHKSNLQ